MQIKCPHCGQGLAIKGVKAGRFKLKCSKCGTPFALTVADDLRPKISILPGAAEPAAAGAQAQPKPAVVKKSVSSTTETLAEEKSAPAAAGHDQQTSADEEKDALRAAHAAAHPDLTAPFESSKAAAASSHDDETEAEGVGDGEATPAVGASKQKPAAASAGQTDLTHEESSRAGTSASAEEMDIPEELGAYDVIKQLGRGGMGAVYLARQRSLDRPVALKVMHREWANNPRFLVRFTREAYAAAQLVHHNVVQVYDIGADEGIHYFSMEFVDGQSLGAILKAKGKVDAKTAAGYTLQAARGLQFAHERGMVHRDVKPDNLMLNRQGIVKVADLGLVRTPSTTDDKPAAELDDRLAAPKPAEKAASHGTLSNLAGVTLANQAMGTPTFMAPEQTINAAGVDERADIYSLGCTLYALVTGKPVFDGKSAVEVMRKHVREAVIPPDKIEKTVPRPLSQIILKSLQKKPEDRYQHTADFIAELEKFLEVGEGGAGALSEEQAGLLEQGAKTFQNVPLAKLRTPIKGGCLAVCVLCFVVLAIAGYWMAAGSILLLAVMTTVACFIVEGFRTHSQIFLKAREYILGNSWIDWAKFGIAALLLAGILALTNLLVASLVVCLIAVIIAFGLSYGLDRTVEAQREGSLDDVEKLLKSFRLKGVSEDLLQERVCKFVGEDWEEVFEQLFGYETKLQARTLWGRGPKGQRPKFAAWRDPIWRFIQARQRSRQEARERSYLQAVEQRKLVSDGLSAAEAKRKAEMAAEAMVEKAAEIKKEALAGRAGVKGKRIDMSEFYTLADKPTPRRPGRSAIRSLEAMILGPHPRLLAGLALLLACLWWLHGSEVLEKIANAPLYEPDTWQTFWADTFRLKPLSIPMVPAEITAPLSTVTAGVAGLLLIFSAFQSVRFLALFHFANAAFMVLGPSWGVPELAGMSPELVCMIAGVAMWALVSYASRWR
jgi:eukaryotic-like serine/threonine-protein kinase